MGVRSGGYGLSIADPPHALRSLAAPERVVPDTGIHYTYTTHSSSGAMSAAPENELGNPTKAHAELGVWRTGLTDIQYRTHECPRYEYVSHTVSLELSLR